MTPAQLTAFGRRCVACGDPFNVLAGHSVAACAAVLNRKAKA